MLYWFQPAPADGPSPSSAHTRRHLGRWGNPSVRSPLCQKAHAHVRNTDAAACVQKACDRAGTSACGCASLSLPVQRESSGFQKNAPLESRLCFILRAAQCKSPFCTNVLTIWKVQMRAEETPTQTTLQKKTNEQTNTQNTLSARK